MLLFAALWHRRHVLGLAPAGDVFEMLAARYVPIGEGGGLPRRPRPVVVSTAYGSVISRVNSAVRLWPVAIPNTGKTFFTPLAARPI